MTTMSKLKAGDRVAVLRPDGSEIEYRGSMVGREGDCMFVLPDDTDLPDPVEVSADRVLPAVFAAIPCTASGNRC
jgi:hypothetical protein